MTRAILNSLSAAATAILAVSPALFAAHDPPAVAERHAGLQFNPTRGHDSDPPLFLDADIPQGAALPVDLYDGILSSRPVRMNAAALDPALGPNRAFDLNLTDNRRFMLVLDSCEVRGPDDYTWRGHLDGWIGSDIVLSCYKDAVAAEISLAPLWRFSLRYLGDGGLHLLTEIDPFKGWSCGTTDVAEPIQAERPDPGSHGGPQDNPIIDIMVLYPQVVQDLLAGPNGARARSQLCIDQINDACANSRLVSRVRLLHNQVISFGESSDYSDMLNRFQDDGTVRQLRFNHGADLVAMLTSRLQGQGFGIISGIAELMDGGQQWGSTCGNSNECWSVTNYLGSTDSLVFAHEIGHNMGAGHGYGDGGGLLPESNGYRFAINLINYGTLMAYDETGGFRTRIKHYSNPDANFTGTFGTQAPTGTSSNANSWTWDRVEDFVAEYRGNRSVTYGDTGSAQGMGTSGCPYHDFAHFVRFTNSGGTVKLGTGTYRENPTISQPMMIELSPGAPAPAFISIP